MHVEKIAREGLGRKLYALGGYLDTSRSLRSPCEERSRIMQDQTIVGPEGERPSTNNIRKRRGTVYAARILVRDRGSAREQSEQTKLLLSEVALKAGVSRPTLYQLVRIQG